MNEILWRRQRGTEWGKWYPTNNDNIFKPFLFEVIRSKNRGFSVNSDNLITGNDTLRIATNYVRPYKPQQRIYLRRRWWEIRAVDIIDVQPQANLFVKPCVNQTVEIELLGIKK